MNKNFTYLLFFITLISNSIEAEYLNELSLKEAIQKAIDNSFELRESEIKKEEIEINLRLVNSKYLPEIIFDSRYNYISNIPSLELDIELPVSVPDIEMAFHNNFMLQISLNQIIFSRPLLYSKKALIKQIEVQENKSKFIMLNIAKKTAEAYFGVLLAKSMLDLNMKFYDAISSHLNNVRNRYKAGASAYYEVLRVEIELDNINQQIEENHKRIKQAISILERITGQKLEGINFTDKLEVETNSYYEESFVEQAYEKRPDLKSLDLYVLALQNQVLSEKSSKYPGLFFNTFLSYQKPYYVVNEWELNLAFGINLRIPIFERNESKLKENLIKNQIENILNTKRKTQEDIKTEIKNVILELNSIKRKIELCENNLKRAEEMVEITRNSYNAGAVISQDVIDAELMVSKIGLECVKNYYDYRIANTNLWFLMGNLEEIWR